MLFRIEPKDLLKGARGRSLPNPSRRFPVRGRSRKRAAALPARTSCRTPSPLPPVETARSRPAADAGATMAPKAGRNRSPRDSESRLSSAPALAADWANSTKRLDSRGHSTASRVPYPSSRTRRFLVAAKLRARPRRGRPSETFGAGKNRAVRSGRRRPMARVGHRCRCHHGTESRPKPKAGRNAAREPRLESRPSSAPAHTTAPLEAGQARAIMEPGSRVVMAAVFGAILAPGCGDMMASGFGAMMAPGLRVYSVIFIARVSGVTMAPGFGAILAPGFGALIGAMLAWHRSPPLWPRILTGPQPRTRTAGPRGRTWPLKGHVPLDAAFLPSRGHAHVIRPKSPARTTAHCPSRPGPRLGWPVSRLEARLGPGAASPGPAGRLRIM